MLETFQSLSAQTGISLETMLMIGIVCGAVLTYFGIASAVTGKSPAAQRMASVALNQKTTRAEKGLLRSADIDPTGIMKSLLPKDRKVRTKIQMQLAQSGITGPDAVRNFYLVRALLGLLLPAVFIVLITASKSTAIDLPDVMDEKLSDLSQIRIFQVLTVLLWIGFFGPTIWLKSRVKGRKQRIENGFPNALDLIQISAEAGLGFDAAMTRVGNELVTVSPDIAFEFLTAQREILAGQERDKALTDMALRTGVEEISSFANVVLQSIQFGTPISEALTTYAEEMRMNRELRAQEKANKLPVQMSAVMASLMLPALLLLTIGPVVIRYIRFNGG